MRSKHAHENEMPGTWTASALSRRSLLAGTGRVAAALVLGMGPGNERALAAQETPFDTFMTVSQRLTGRQGLDPGLGQRVFEALRRHESRLNEFVQQLSAQVPEDGSALDGWIQQLQGDNQDLANAAFHIVTAWYTGQVGEARPHDARPPVQPAHEERRPEPEVVAYEAALMFIPVADVLTIPSYCRDVPGYWAKAPEKGSAS